MAPPITRVWDIFVEADDGPADVVAISGATVVAVVPGPAAEVPVVECRAGPPTVTAATAAAIQAPTPTRNLRTLTALDVTTPRSSFLVETGSTHPVPIGVGSGGRYL